MFVCVCVCEPLCVRILYLRSYLACVKGGRYGVHADSPLQPPLSSAQHAALISQLLRHVLRAIGSADPSTTRLPQPKAPSPAQALFAERCIGAVVALSASPYAVPLLPSIAQVR